ncbi:MAG: aconitase X swivel domain-containing protein [Anaerolineales bacterium]
MAELIRAKSILAGNAKGEALVSPEPLSFWGGYDQRTGEIIDRRHPLSGQVATGRILALPHSRGSSTTTAVLLEALRAGTAPAAILTTAEDAFFALAGIVAEEMYGSRIPMLTIDDADFERLETGQHIEVDSKGIIRISD